MIVNTTANYECFLRAFEVLFFCFISRSDNDADRSCFRFRTPESYPSARLKCWFAPRRLSVMQSSIKTALFLFCTSTRRKRESKFVALSKMKKNSYSGFHKFSFNSTREIWEMYEHRVWSFSKLGHVMMKRSAWTLALLIRLANACLVCYKKNCKHYFLKYEDSSKNNRLAPLE